jgi:hypothetical protein
MDSNEIEMRFLLHLSHKNTYFTTRMKNLVNKTCILSHPLEIESYSLPAAATSTISRMMKSPSKKGLKYHAAETLMQRFRTIFLARDAQKSGMTCALANTLTFAELNTELRSKPLIKTMRILLNSIMVLTAHGVRQCPLVDFTQKVKVSVFLASFFIAYKASDVFQTTTTLSTELQVAAVNMLNVFDALFLKICAASPGDDISMAVNEGLEFPSVLDKYLKAYQAWKLAEAPLQEEIHLVSLVSLDSHA